MRQNHLRFVIIEAFKHTVFCMMLQNKTTRNEQNTKLNKTNTKSLPAKSKEKKKIENLQTKKGHHYYEIHQQVLTHSHVLTIAHKYTHSHIQKRKKEKIFYQGY